ncbi:hypothetical protein GUITHDRAFT_153366, partial [Guillardia theta CCMP2712]
MEQQQQQQQQHEEEENQEVEADEESGPIIAHLTLATAVYDSQNLIQLRLGSCELRGEGVGSV